MYAATMWLSTLVGENARFAMHVRILVLFVASVVMIHWMVRRLWQPSIWLFAIFMAAGVAGGSSAWNNTSDIIEGVCAGEVTVRTDPTWVGHGVGVVVELHRVRYRVIAHGTSGARLAQRLAGERVLVRGQCKPTIGAYARYDRITHVLGRMNVEYVSEEFSEGSAMTRAANRMRRSLADGVSSMRPDLRALFTGLVIGDDREQSRSMISEFRSSGLSHLCAVSGQNVAYLLAVLAPLLRRLRPNARLIATVCVIAWFVVLTRGEPSVLRAALMAGVVAANAATRTPMNARTVLALTVIILLVIDPMLAWSVGFALSVGATAGLAWLSSRIQRIVGGRGMFASTLSAQIGTMPVSFFVFGYVPVVSLIANPLALTVAGGVMMVGLPFALLGSTISSIEPLVSTVMTVPVLWVAQVAHIASMVSPKGVANVVLWALVAWGMWRKWSHAADGT